MTPALLFILIFAVADVTLSAPVDDYKNDELVGDSEIVPRLKADFNAAVLQGDIAVPNTLSRNADKCTERGCKWPKSGSYVYVPYYISKTFSQEERDVIIRGMQGFNQSTCIRLIPWKPEDRDYIFIESKDGCWSYVGRQNGGQYLSLQKTGCVHNEVVQHEILHALGFNHEQVRSDRDSYVRILFDNIEPNFKFAFEKKETNNLGTPYDFTSVMEYRNDAFSKNGKPTIVAKCDPNLKFGNSKKMSANDIIRINKLYECTGLPGLKRSASRPKRPKNEQLPF